MPRLPENKLTSKQERFVEEYLVDFNATKAAIRAGYSKNGAGIQGFYLLRNIKIMKRLAHKKAELAKRSALTVDMVVDELKKIAFRPEMEKDTAKIKALELLAKYLGMFEGKGESPPINIGVIVGGNNDKRTPEEIKRDIERNNKIIFNSTGTRPEKTNRF